MPGVRELQKKGLMDRFVWFIREHATEKERAMQDAFFGLIGRFFEEVKPDGV